MAGGWINSGPEGTNVHRPFGLVQFTQRLRTGGFQAIELNLVGWISLLGPGVVIGLLFARLTDRSFWLWGAVGGLVIWIVALTIDNYRFGRRDGRLHADALDEPQLERLAEAARYAGISYEHEFTDSPDGAQSTFHAQQRHINRLGNLLRETR